MAVDLYLALDDDLFADFAADAKRLGTTVEERLRRAIYEGVDRHYEPLTLAGVLDRTRPSLMLDCRTR